MISSKLRRNGFTALAGVFLLLSGSSPVSFAQDVPDQPADVQRGGETTLQVATDSALQVGTVIVETLTEGVLNLAPVRFWVSAGNKVFVEWFSTNPPPKPSEVGIIVDDGVPF